MSAPAASSAARTACLVVDHEPEVAVGVGLLAALPSERAMNWSPASMKAMPGLAAAQAQLEDLAVEGERLVEVADLEGDVVDADEPGGHARASAGSRRWEPSSAAGGLRAGGVH